MRLSEIYPKEYVAEQLEKGGEGSRGGQVIGHNKNGSPIYDTHSIKFNNKRTTGHHHDIVEATDKRTGEIFTHHRDPDTGKEGHEYYRGENYGSAGKSYSRNYEKDKYPEKHRHIYESLAKIHKEHYGNKTSLKPISSEQRAQDEARGKSYSKAVSLDDYAGEHLQKSFVSLDLEKGGKGEGSRGGKVIGHTSSGKPVYEKHSVHTRDLHKHYTSQDHMDAETIHLREAKKNYDQGIHSFAATGNRYEQEYHRAMEDHHKEEANQHHIAANEKAKIEHEKLLTPDQKKIVADRRKKDLQESNTLHSAMFDLHSQAEKYHNGEADSHEAKLKEQADHDSFTAKYHRVMADNHRNQATSHNQKAKEHKQLWVG